MNVTSLLCDHAQVSSDMKLFIAGANITMLRTAMAEPPLAVNVALAVVVQIDWNETNQPHKIAIELIYDDPAGASRVELPIPAVPGMPDTGGAFHGQFNVGRSPEMISGESSLMPIALNMPGLLLPAPGSYFFSVSINGEPVSRTPFRVVSLQPGMFPH